MYYEFINFFMKTNHRLFIHMMGKESVNILAHSLKNIPSEKNTSVLYNNDPILCSL